MPPAKKKAVSRAKPVDDQNPIADLSRAALRLAEETRTGNAQLELLREGIRELGEVVQAQQVQLSALQQQIDTALEAPERSQRHLDARMQQFVEQLSKKIEAAAQVEAENDPVLRKLDAVERWIESDMRSEAAAKDAVERASDRISQLMKDAVLELDGQLCELKQLRRQEVRTDDHKLRVALKLLIDDFRTQMTTLDSTVNSITDSAVAINGFAKDWSDWGAQIKVADLPSASNDQSSDSSLLPPKAIAEILARIEPTIVNTLVSILMSESSASERN